MAVAVPEKQNAIYGTFSDRRACPISAGGRHCDKT